MIHVDGPDGEAQLVRGAQMEALGPQGILAAQNAGAGTGDASGEGSDDHWTKGFTDQYGDDAQTRQVALADVQGPGTEYLRELNKVATGDVTYGAKAELLDVQYQEVTKQAGVLTKLAVQIAANAMGLGAVGEFLLSAGVEGAISGEIDPEALVKDAAFIYASAELSSVAKSQIGISAPVEGTYFSGDWVQNAAVNATVNATTQTAIYGGSFSENLTDAYETALIDEGTGFVQNFVGDIKGKDGSLIGILGHAGAGCITSDLKGGNCAQGAVNAAAAEIATGIIDRETEAENRTENIIRDYVNPTLAALSSGGDVGQFSINQGISDSQLKNNYLTHSQRGVFLAKLAICDGNEGCINATVQEYTKLSDENNAELIAAIQSGDLDRIEEIRAQIPTDMLEYQAMVFDYLKDDPVAAEKFADVLNEGSVVNINGNLVTASDATFYALRDGYYGNDDVESLAALGVSEFGPMGLSPNLTGLLGARGVIGAGRVSTVTEPSSSYSFRFKLPERVTHFSGVSLSKSQTQMIRDFDLAGYPTKPVISPTSGKHVGTQYTLPDGSRVRVMQADGRNQKRASFENANGQPINPITGKPPQPPSGLTRAERKQYVRDKTHIVQDY